MKSIFTKVQLANQEEFDKFIFNNPNIKYVDAILSDLSGIIRGKRLPIEDAHKLFTLWCAVLLFNISFRYLWILS